MPFVWPFLISLQAALVRFGWTIALLILTQPFEHFRSEHLVWKHLFRATSSHVTALVTVFDFGGDPAADFVRMRMVPPFG